MEHMCLRNASGDGNSQITQEKRKEEPMIETDRQTESKRRKTQTIMDRYLVNGQTGGEVDQCGPDEMQSDKPDKPDESVCGHVDEETSGSGKTCVNRGAEHVDGETGVVSQVISRIDGRPSVDGETSAVSQVADSVDGETSGSETTCVNKGPEQVDG